MSASEACFISGLDVYWHRWDTPGPSRLSVLASQSHSASLVRLDFMVYKCILYLQCSYQCGLSYLTFTSKVRFFSPCIIIVLVLKIDSQDNRQGIITCTPPHTTLDYIHYMHLLSLSADFVPDAVFIIDVPMIHFAKMHVCT